MARGKVIFISALMAAALIAGLFLLLPARKPMPNWILPDGSKLQLLKVTYGTTNHAFDYGHSLKDRLFPLVPAAYRKKFNFQMMNLSIPPPGGLVLWFEHSGYDPATANLAMGGRPFAFSVRVFDEAGNENWPSSIHPRVLGTNTQLVALTLSHYPRRAKTINFRLYESTASDARQLAEFQVRNPAPQHPREWAPETLPATRRTNNLELKLLSFLAGPAALELPPAGRLDQPSIHAAFEVRESGNVTSKWSITGLTFSNVLGESFETGFSLVGRIHNVGDVEIPARFWAEDPAWKMHVELAKIGALAPDAKWTIHGLEVPDADGPAPVSTNLTTNLLGAQLTLTTIEVAGVTSTPRFMPPGKTLSLVFETPVSLWIDVPQVSDDQGRRLESRGKMLRLPPNYRPVSANPYAPQSPSQQDFHYTVPEGTKTVNVTVGASRLAVFEFLVKPATNSVPSPLR